MSKFNILTKYIPIIQADSIGEWIVDKESDGTPEHLIQMPFVEYSEMVHNFIDDVYAFEESNKDMELTVKSEIVCKFPGKNPECPVGLSAACLSPSMVDRIKLPDAQFPLTA
jgi:hypothetical protein